MITKLGKGHLCLIEENLSFNNNNNTSNKEAHISDLISPHTKLLGWNGFV